MTSTEYVCGAALFFRAAVARKIGLLDERFFLVYEDSDWCFRARRAGFACVSVPKARVWHKVGTSFGSESSPLRTYFSTRNKLLWTEKNVSRREWWDILRAALRRLYPGFALDRKACVPAHKALLWAGRGSCTNGRENSVIRRRPRIGAVWWTTSFDASATVRRGFAHWRERGRPRKKRPRKSPDWGVKTMKGDNTRIVRKSTHSDSVKP